MKEHQTKVNQIKNSIDMNVAKINRLPVIMSSNEIIRFFWKNEKRYNYMQISKELDKYLAGDDFIDTIFLYPRGSSTIFSDKASYDIEYFNKNIFVFNEWHHDEFFEDINRCVTSKVRGLDFVKDKNKSYITFIYPLPMETKFADETLLVTVSENSIKDLMGINEKTITENLLIFDENFDLIISNTPIEEKNIAIILNSFSKSEDYLYTTLKIDQHEYILSAINSKQTTWNYVHLLDKDVLMKEVKDLRQKAMLILLLVVIVSGFCIFYMTKRMYLPIDNLNKIAKKRLLPEEINGQEFSIIQLAMDKMTKDIEMMNKQLDNQKDAVKEYLL
ncbi:MAG: hypothetical protein MJE63_23135, partial [Proteobacteria bacterium]|nr:hypothetical protein [Pseudomonadota bacterium]